MTQRGDTQPLRVQPGPSGSTFPRLEVRSRRAQMSDLLRVTRAWLLTDLSTLSILDKVVLDCFLRVLPQDMKRAASLCASQTYEVLLEAVEMHQNTQALLSLSQAESATRSRGSKKSTNAVYPEPTVGRVKGKQTPGETAGVGPTRHQRPQVDGDQRRCFECGAQGHIAWNCSAREESMQLASPGGEVGHAVNYVTSCWAHHESIAPMVPVKVDGHDTVGPLDSGSMVTLVTAHLGMEKTREQIAARFHWPGMRRDMEEYCRRCPECHLTAPKAHFTKPICPPTDQSGCPLNVSPWK